MVWYSSHDLCSNDNIFVQLLFVDKSYAYSSTIVVTYSYSRNGHLLDCKNMFYKLIQKA